MSWTVPKTNWTKNDYLNYDDFNKQKDNVSYIATVALPSLYYFPTHTSISDADGDTKPETALINTLESNLSGIEDCGISLPTAWEDSKTWTTDKPDYNDVNRWENDMLLIYNMILLIQQSFKLSGTFYAGEDFAL